MKKIFIIFVLILLNSDYSEAKSPFLYGRISFQTFYYSLAPYGEWIEIDYGVYAWRPLRIHLGWAPYLIGRWVWTPYGWYWDSFEPFGWAVYHYGRWYYDDYYGWIWIPDYEWGPAWVEWRYNNGYIGWAPLPPYASFSVSVGVRFSITWYSPHYYWHFVPIKYFCGYEVHRYVVGPKYKYRIYRDSRYSVDYKYNDGRIINSGIDRNFVEKRGGKVFETDVEKTTRLRDFTERNISERNRVLIYQPDEREFDRNVDVKVRKTEKQISLEFDKIQTPREKIAIQNIDRKSDQIQQKRNNDIEKYERDRIFEREIHFLPDIKTEERKIDDRKIEHKTDINPPVNSYNKREMYKSDDDGSFRELDKNKINRNERVKPPVIERKNEIKHQPQTKRDYPSMNPNGYLDRKRNSENTGLIFKE